MIHAIRIRSPGPATHDPEACLNCAQFSGIDSNLSSFRIPDLQVGVKKSSKRVVQTQWKSKTMRSKRSGTILFKDHVRVVGVKKGIVSMKAFTVPLQKATKLNLKAGDLHTAFYVCQRFEFLCVQVLISSPKKKTSGKKVPKSGIFEGVKVFTAWSTISRSLNHPKPCLLFPFRFFAVEHSGCFAATTRASAAPSGRGICARASSLLFVRPHLLYACLIV